MPKMPKMSGLGEEPGKSFGKYDMDRVGLFSEMPYLINEKYKTFNYNSKCD